MMANWKLLSCSSFFFSVSAILLVMQLGEAFSFKKPTIEKKLHPVIYVPGFGGSQLDVNISNKYSLGFCTLSNFDNSIWLDWENAIYISKIAVNRISRCWIDHVKLVYNKYTHKTSDAPGVELSVPGWGDPSIVEWLLREPFAVKVLKALVGGIDKLPERYFKFLQSIVHQSDYFIQISKALIALGLQRNISIRSAPYDFRKAPNEQQLYFLKLKHLVEETYRSNKNTPVVLLTHSMGGPLTLHFLNQQTQEWKDKFIKSFISLSGAWGGSMKAMKIYTEGDDLGINFFSAKTLKQVLVTAPALAWMLPSPKFWGKDKVLASTSNRSYTVSNMKDFFYDINQPLAWEMYKDVINYTTDCPPGVEVHCLHGTQRKTLEQLHYHGDFGRLPSHEWNNDGDGTVNLRSLTGCTRWSKMQREKVYHKAFKGVEHTAILQDRRVIEYIKSVVRGEK